MLRPSDSLDKAQPGQHFGSDNPFCWPSLTCLRRFSMRLVRYVIPALASLCLVSRPLSAQGGGARTVHGQVTDSITKQGLAAATVSIVGKQRVTQSGPVRNYSLADVPAGLALRHVTPSL